MPLNLYFSPTLIRRLKLALYEDIQSGDITTNLIVPRNFDITAKLITRESCVISGLILIPIIFRFLSAKVKVTLIAKEGSQVKAGQTIATISGPARAILTGERVAINFAAKLSGIATATHEFVKRIEPYHTELLATRKTAPLLRDVEKYAVQCGGGHTHRQGLFDQYMVKDNHKEVLKAMGARLASKAIERLRRSRKKGVLLTVEVDSVREIPWAMSFRPEIILLDNFSISDLRKAVRFVRELSKDEGVAKPLLEASGGIALDKVRAIAKTGVERISVGSITHSVRSMNFSLEVTSPEALSSRA